MVVVVTQFVTLLHVGYSNYLAFISCLQQSKHPFIQPVVYHIWKNKICPEK